VRRGLGGRMGGVLVHEWISSTGGSENVFEAMGAAFPEADLLCLWNDAPERFPGRVVHETWLARSPLRRHKAAAVPLIPMTWRRRRSPGYEWVLASTHLFAHHVSFAGGDVPKLAYVYTPARYIWNPELDERGASWPVTAAARPLRGLDRRRAREPVRIATISAFVRERVQVAWERDSDVIYPPVDVARIQDVPRWADTVSTAERRTLDALPRPFLLGASRFVPYKRLDQVIRAGELCGLPVVLAGAGPGRDELLARAGAASVPVTIVDRPSDELLFALYESALAYVFPPVEDFGIMPVEAMAAGCPVVANRTGGAAETVLEGVSGALCGWDSDEELVAAVERAVRLDRDVVRAHAVPFDAARFRREIGDWVAGTVGAAARGGGRS